MNRTSVISGIVLIVVAIILGAFGAHALEEKLSLEQLQTFEVGVRYQMYHGITLLAIGLSSSRFDFSLKPFVFLVMSGVVAFSVSIYFLAMQDLLGAKLSFLGPITPLGGTLLIAAWVFLLWKVIKMKEAKTS